MSCRQSDVSVESDGTMTAPGHHFECPDYRHVPGRNARPSGSFVQVIADRAMAVRDLCDPEVRFAWRYGIFLIGKGFFWEAHEVLEPVWMKAPPNSRERLMVQGFIQLANACLKVEMARPRAARRLSEMACALLEDSARSATGAVLGADPDRCLAMIRRLADAIARDDDWRRVLVDVSAIERDMHDNA